ncbi:cytochrome c-type biogenesis protein [Roseospira marina]|uniref:cytochrome c-type biogenesis protein n=1 Tax=Roseospira marina TaxID=140057 RepID=UPI001790E795|nr:cytochrome c-type biogenesis protein [Roseospira marina]MBB4314843.1 cytochrome c-type biogenesis protein CcmH [Roseospira marina]MBB5087843.1 cytochrome c-type biogenesis protein CcmH [Roseospira marina]
MPFLFDAERRARLAGGDTRARRGQGAVPCRAFRYGAAVRALALAGVLGVALATVAPTPGWAVEPDEMLDDPALEARAREVSRDLRCVVCQNESIDESNADMARDMRLLVRDRIEQGDSNEEVKQYLVDRYGDYVLLKPPFKPTTYVLWFGPALILAAAAAAAVSFYRRRAAAPPSPPPLSAAEQARLQALIDESEGSKDDDGAGRGGAV